MCGIAGSVNLPEVKIAKDTMLHRGPDSFGVWEEENVVLVHRRLAILDLSELGHQPMEYENLVITYNGEVYNYKNIREELIVLGYQFNSNTDTEVILKAYHAFGENCVQKFNGMFAFCIYDKANKRMFIARDHIGIKPLYYYFKNKTFAFGSELKAFPDHLKKNNNTEALIKFMVLSYIPAPNTAYQDFYKLEPGSYLLFDIERNQYSITKYWAYNDKSTHSKYTINSYDEAVSLVETKLKESVKMQLEADVPVGAFLSGGIDSSLITALAQEVSTQKIKTYAMGFAEKQYDESPFAKEVADYLSTDHTTLTFTPEDLLSLIKDYDFYYDEPFGDSASLPLSILCKKAKENGITVALSGDGGDELFLGYERYSFAKKYSNLFSKNPKLLRKPLSSALSLTGKDKALKMKYPVENPSMINFFQILSTCIKPWDLKKALKDDILEKEFGKGEVTIFDILNLDPMMITEEKDLAEIDIRRNLPDDMLVKADRASMRFSLEMRVPILDKEIMEISAAIPNKFLLQNGELKSILKDILYKYVPKEMMDRPKKGFSVPIEIWFRNELKEEVLALKENIPYFMNDAYVKNIIDEHLYKNKNHYYIIWNLMRLNKFIKNVE